MIYTVCIHTIYLCIYQVYYLLVLNYIMMYSVVRLNNNRPLSSVRPAAETRRQARRRTADRPRTSESTLPPVLTASGKHPYTSPHHYQRQHRNIFIMTASTLTLRSSSSRPIALTYCPHHHG